MSPPPDPASSSSGGTPRPSIAMTGIAVAAPLVVLVLLAGFVPGLTAALLEHDRPVPTLTGWFVRPRLPVALAGIYAVQLVGIAVSWKVPRFHRPGRSLIRLCAIGWVVLALAGAVALAPSIIAIRGG